MKAILMILAFTALAACSQDDEDMNGFNLENQIYFSLKNSDGQNLLDTETENSININDIQLYYLIDDEPVEVTIENGYNMGSIELTSDKLLKVFTNPSSSNIIDETSEYEVVENIAYLKFSETDTDTIKTHSKSSQNYFLLSEVWYNDELVWERETGGVIEIMKE
ncbi:hypothetical protein ACFQ0R_11835 [Psychroflexus salinarum]|uniref:Lipoprotein n=1 Tax=Psychroflexus salinarum TaxID=546024 RepID=A0ABW3GSS0_9FLAO